MQGDRKLCPVCRSSRLIMKYEAKYVYSYVIDEDKPGLKNETEFLPFLYDRREQVEADQYIECSSCGARLPVFYSQVNDGFDFRMTKGSISARDETPGATGDIPADRKY